MNADQRLSAFIRGFGFVFRCSFDERSARHLVALIGLDQADALGAATGLADVRGLEADELALLRDDHDLRIVLNRKHRNDLAGLVSRLHVDDTFTATRLQSISRDRSLLPVTLLGN